jgi:hypothetical protein
MHSLFVLTLVLFAPSEGSTTPPVPFTAARFREHVAYLASDDLAGSLAGSAERDATVVTR